MAAQPQPAPAAEPARSPKSWLATLLLAIFLGYLGIHRFYTGHLWVGILMLLTGGVFGILWIIDIILIAVGAFRDADGLPVRP